MSDEIIISDQEVNVNIVDNRPIINISAPGPKGDTGPAGAGGGTNFNILSISSAYTVDFTYNYLECDCSADPFTVTLPTSTSSNKGQSVWIARVDLTSFSLTVQTTGGQSIVNVNDTSVIQRGGSVYIYMSTGTGWTVN